MQAELEALLEASDIYATRRIFLCYWAGSRGRLREAGGAAVVRECTIY